MIAGSVQLERLTWVEAESVLTPDAVVLIPLGAAAKEHGPHLRLNNDWAIAQYLTRKVLEAVKVVVAPGIGYHYFPAFVEYPGSVTLRLETARDLVIDICMSLAAFGPRRFYVLNTGVSTVLALRPAADALAARGLLLRYTDIRAVGRGNVAGAAEQEGGSHADEVETSLMLFIEPEAVDMVKAVRDYHPGEGPLTRRRGAPGAYSPTGVHGDATLATWGKGRAVAHAMVSAILADIARLRSEPLPAAAR